MTEFYNVDITVAAEDGAKKSELKEQIRGAIDSANHDLDHTVMVSRVDEVEE